MRTNRILKKLSGFPEKTKKHLKGISPRCAAGVLALIDAMLLPRFLSDRTLGFSNSFLSVICAVLLYFLLKNHFEREHHRRELVLTHLFGFLLSSMTAIGKAFESSERFFPVGFWTVISILLYTQVFAAAVSFLWEKLNAFEPQSNLSSPLVPSWLRKTAAFITAHPFMIALLLLLCWTPCYIALFPGGFSYDARTELMQYELYGVYLRDLPRLHTVLIRTCLKTAYRLFGSYNAGIAIYAAVQMTAFSAMFAHMLITLYRQRTDRRLLCLAALCLAAFPVIHLTVTHTGRDTLFAGLFTYLTFLLYRLAADTQAFMSRLKNPALLGVTLSLTLLSRNNSRETVMLLLLVLLNVIVWFRSHKVFPHGVVTFSAANIAAYLAVSLLLNAVCQPVSNPNPIPSMSLISQTLVRAYVEEPEKWSQADEAALHRFIEMDGVTYCPEFADPTKNAISKDGLRSDGAGFVRLWLKMAVRCPGAYMNAFLAQSRYMWYPDSVIDGYVRGGIYQTEKCYFVTGVEQPGTRIHLWQTAEDFYTEISKNISFEKIPVVSMLFSIGFQFWLLLNCLFYSVYRRKKSLYLPLTAIFVYLAFCLFLPIVLMRYFMSVFLLFPLTAAMTFHEEKTSPGSDN